MPSIILAVVIINAALGVFQENKAEEAIEALKKMASPLANVRRGGEVVQIKSDITCTWRHHRLGSWGRCSCRCPLV